MATDNRGVTCYLPIEVERALSEFCRERGITRKDKEGNQQPSLGTGIIEALKLLFGVIPNTLPSGVPSRDELAEAIRDILPGILPSLLPSNGLNQDEVIKTVKAIMSSMVLDTLPSNLLTREELTESIGSLKSELLSLKAENDALRQRIETLFDEAAVDAPPMGINKEALSPIFEEAVVVAVDDQVRLTIADIARLKDLNRPTLSKWLKKYDGGGEAHPTLQKILTEYSWRSDSKTFIPKREV